MNWKEAAKLVRQSRKPVITTHEMPDGDAIGAEVGLAEGLRSIGLDPIILNSHPLSPSNEFLQSDGEPLVFDPAHHAELLNAADLFIMVDANFWDRAGTVGEAMAALNKPSLCIDHHFPAAECATINCATIEASSASELIHYFCEHLGAERTARSREAIYTGLLFDTGNFRFSNTSHRVHEIAATLIEEGIVAEHMYQKVFEHGTLERMKLFGLALSTLQSACDGQLVWFLVKNEMFAESGGAPTDVEGFVDMVRTIHDSRMVIMFRDTPDGIVKASLRSKTNDIDVQALARKFGGGGHKRASGVTLQPPIQQAVEAVVAEAGKLLG
ncbi:MAG: bifunctional oligoribonuclease/PAP phosphatase NrnA [Planctomycetota bacterium]|jgi:phosphoesterase RecJ-like protein|nr:bifunctional oligoribonuclease/PAP phosphatase NrnA [Planctomycetota bacterium]